MPGRDVFFFMPVSRYRRSLTNCIAHWASFDEQDIDPMDVEQLRVAAALLQVDPTRVYAAIKQVGGRAGDVRRYLQQESR